MLGLAKPLQPHRGRAYTVQGSQGASHGGVDCHAGSGGEGWAVGVDEDAAGEELHEVEWGAEDRGVCTEGKHCRYWNVVWCAWWLGE